MWLLTFKKKCWLRLCFSTMYKVIKWSHYFRMLITHYLIMCYILYIFCTPFLHFWGRFANRRPVHFWGRFANRGRLVNLPQKCKKGVQKNVSSHIILGPPIGGLHSSYMKRGIMLIKIALQSHFDHFTTDIFCKKNAD